MSKQSKIDAFDPNSPAAANAGAYGLPFTTEEADIVLVPVPWEVTTSYGGGTSRGPAAILEASLQVDLFHPEFPGLWERGIAMDELPEALLEQSDALKAEIEHLLDCILAGRRPWVTGEDGRRALETATRITALLTEGR